MMKLIRDAVCRIMTNRQREGSLMKTITLSPTDAAQVKAILLTHAELVDNHSLPSLELIGTMQIEMKREPDDEVQAMIVTLQEQVDDIEADSENLKRLASLF